MKAGYTIVSKHSVIDAKPLPPNKSAQKAKLMALTWALTLGERKIRNVNIDSKYTFFFLYAHTAIWNERGFFF